MRAGVQAFQIRGPLRYRYTGGSLTRIAILGSAHPLQLRDAPAREYARAPDGGTEFWTPSRCSRATHSTSLAVTASPRCSAQIHVSATHRSTAEGASPGNSAARRRVTVSLAPGSVQRTCRVCAPELARWITACMSDLCQRCSNDAMLPQSHFSSAERSVKSLRRKPRVTSVGPELEWCYRSVPLARDQWRGSQCPVGRPQKAAAGAPAPIV
jgi:hypothetical protein